MDDIPNSDATLGLFLLTSFPTALLVSLLLFAPAPAQDPPPSRFDRALRAAGFEQNSRMLKFLVLLLVVVILPMFAVIGFGPLHGKQHPFFSYYGYLLGGNFRHIVEGVLFGLIVPFWIARVYRTDPAAKWPLSLYLETAFVLLVFVLEIGRASCRERV